MTRNTALIGTLVASLWTAGCLEKETTHTLYLTPEGEVAWMAIERNVRSDEAQPAARLEEEETYLTAAVAGSGDLARGLAALGPTELRSRVLRDERPFAVLTEARFADVEVLTNRILSELHLTGKGRLTRVGDIFTLRVHVEVGDAGEDSDDTPVIALVEDVEAYRIVLTEGKFFAAEGFTLSPDGAIAIPTEITHDEVQARAGIDLSLSWKRR